MSLDSHEARLTRLIAIRHGETAWNVDTRIQGQLDIGLNETGRWQAGRLARALADVTIDAVYSSDLLRALDTARAVANVAGQPVRLDASLRERGFGSFEGLTYAEVESRFPDEARRWRQRDPQFAPEGGESLADFQARAVAAVAAIASRHRGQHVVVFTHGGVLDALYRAASHITLDAPRTWHLGNAGINRLLHGDHGFTLVGWADMLHLEAPSLEEGSA
ncbi:MAG: histidine phosphatase family protein [Aquincola sp.]|nr:histidine phosphatase family protein [Aquincola sp.]MDH4288861.1 histidine phosphatase family protein [Aquincola sp.]MDH5328524.1 histidine phosphatase family protein [Aquincola sp.]